MNRVTLSFALIALALGVISCNYQTQGKSQPAALPGDAVSAARTFVDLLAKGDFAAAEKAFDSEMRGGLPQDKLEATWKAVQSQYGPFKKQVSMKKGKAQGYDLVVIKCEFEKGLLGIRLAFNKEGQVSGLFFDPVE